VYGNNQIAPLLLNESRKCGIYTQWSFTQLWRRMESYHLQVNEWNWRTSFWARLARLRRPEIVCSASYVDFMSRANTAMCLNLDHMTGDSTYGRYGTRMKTQNMKVFDVPTLEELIQKP
jgi:hypothetical protein